MTITRTKQILASLVTIAALFVSAVSACACTHHEPAKKAEELSSCHGAAHETANIADESESRSDILEATCNCFVKAPTPAIVAKSDEKRISLEQHVDDSESAIAGVEFVALWNAASPAIFEPPQWDHRSTLLSSLPSRAPPRL